LTVRNSRIAWRKLVALLWLAMMPCLSPAWGVETLRIGLTPAFLNERHGLIADWQAYLERKLGRPVAFVLRDSHQETMELLHQRSIQAAWLCDCPLVTANPEFRLLATPLFQGRPYYRAYLIVPETDKSTHSILDLKGKVFAYTDPYSNVGYVNPRYQIKQQGADPDHFFRRTFFTRSHRKAIEAVAVGVADASSVSSYIWETMQKQAPILTSRTRVAVRSPEYGFPPFVADEFLSEKEFHDLQQALMEMSEDPSGRSVLRQMNIDGFVLPKPEIYEPVQMVRTFMQGG
jgi:phosphonate transport system substrate-binding protein